MKSTREVYNENIARIDAVLNGKGNPNRDKIGRFARGPGASGGNGKSISDKELTEIARGVWYDIQGPNSQTKTPQTKTPEQMLLERIYAKQGYNKKPKLINTEQFLAEKDGIKVYRGVIDMNLKNNYAKDFIQGEKHYPGIGVFGTGTYSSQLKSEAESYALKYAFPNNKVNGQVISMIIPKNAKNIIYEDANTLSRDFGNRLYEKTKSIKVTDIKDVGFASWNASVYKDTGIWAAAHGYDTISVDPGIGTRTNSTIYVILNRGILKVDKNVRSL